MKEKKAVTTSQKEKKKTGKKKSYHKVADTALSQYQKREIMHFLHFQLTSNVPFSFLH